MSIERFLKSVHSWLGVLILPWILIIGFTGLYMNHRDLVLSVFPKADAGPASFVASPTAGPGDSLAAASALAVRLMPGSQLELSKSNRFLERQVFTFSAGTSRVIVDRLTGHGWVDSRYSRSLYDPTGRRIATEVKWGRVLSSLHQRGWVGTALGPWLADITAVAMMIFAASGLWLFTAPRLRRARNRRARQRASVTQSA